MVMPYTYGALFAGIGGMCRGFLDAGFSQAFSVDIDPGAAEAHKLICGELLKPQTSPSGASVLQGPRWRCRRGSCRFCPVFRGFATALCARRRAALDERQSHAVPMRRLDGVENGSPSARRHLETRPGA